MEILWIILGILVFAIVMTVLVTVHEGGHFIMAKKAGVLCHEFAIYHCRYEFHAIVLQSISVDTNLM